MNDDEKSLDMKPTSSQDQDPQPSQMIASGSRKALKKAKKKLTKSTKESSSSESNPIPDDDEDDIMDEDDQDDFNIYPSTSAPQNQRKPKTPTEHPIIAALSSPLKHECLIALQELSELLVIANGMVVPFLINMCRGGLSSTWNPTFFPKSGSFIDCPIEARTGSFFGRNGFDCRTDATGVSMFVQSSRGKSSCFFFNSTQWRS